MAQEIREQVIGRVRREFRRPDLAQVEFLDSLAGSGVVELADQAGVDGDVWPVHVEVEVRADFGDVGAVGGWVEGFGEEGEEDSEDEFGGEGVWAGGCEGVQGWDVGGRGVVDGEEDALVCG